jgi:hypothetical protein
MEELRQRRQDTFTESMAESGTVADPRYDAQIPLYTHQTTNFRSIQSDGAYEILCKKETPLTDVELCRIYFARQRYVRDTIKHRLEAMLAGLNQTERALADTDYMLEPTAPTDPNAYQLTFEQIERRNWFDRIHIPPVSKLDFVKALRIVKPSPVSLQSQMALAEFTHQTGEAQTAFGAGLMASGASQLFSD